MTNLPVIVEYLITFILSMTPIIELRGAIPVGVAMGLSYLEAFIISFVGNIIPIYFIVKFIKPLFNFFGKFKPFKKIIDWATDKATKHIETNEKLQNYTMLGLFIFVAIPLPGTGAWVGSLIANFLNIPVKKAFWPLAAGVLTAGVIILTLTAIAAGGLNILFQHG
jgi:uncharacterized membrane protein